MRMKPWPIEVIEEHIVAAGYRSVKEWRIESWASHLAAQRMGVVPFFAAKYNLDYNPKMGRSRREDSHDTRRVRSVDGKLPG